MELTSSSSNKLNAFLSITRLNRPIGIYLLLWPTLWSLWLAADGLPDWHLIIIFCLGVTVMRSAGCVINDIADRHFDGHVKRTQNRPLVTGAMTLKEAMGCFVALCIIALILVLFTNQLTILLSFGALALAISYPFMKRYTHFPQIVLGAAFSWSIPMAYTAQTGELNHAIWLLFWANLAWTVAYDTAYAMVDRDDDLKIGVKSTAILFGKADKLMIGLLQIITLALLSGVGYLFQRGWLFFIGIGLMAGLFIYQQYLIKDRDRSQCFKAFLNNHWAGMFVFVGIVCDSAVS
ncbi:4-hydroxybenzoate octaprenyltransferase [Endozoicomonas sp. SM1973]|uniref:4-hydroxybenzoate octaprenyltransferase n=1 Tax=Spartinivicinus marinus TaxID=2994442 RepID=A0A853I2E5_9GAMM|nr:4-hydroxybenzoate octaprenyltransferase [Spartinivicinus marinus]MCX4026547.1 4-hydroxybenzoate octaprenyltransferase [Spartinivicinus marinus]NYZ64384.1 4-hydroxybenzoate octaprenyltransferase [Spartinivicinus marinus]